MTTENGGDPNIQVVLTDEDEMHCFKLVFGVRHPYSAPLEMYLHTRQAFDLFHKLGEKLMDYFARESAELLRRKMQQLEQLQKDGANLNADRKREAQR